MKMHRVEGILAISTNQVVGQGDMLPWHHSGDLKRFKRITMGHGMLLGYPTFAGMAKKYGKLGYQLLPGRSLFVVGREPFETRLGIDCSNVEFLPTYGPQDDLETVLGYLNPEQRLFIGGGARIYRDYLPFAERIYLTEMDIECPVDYDTVFLNDSWSFMQHGWRSKVHEGSEICNGVKANYITMSSVL